MQIFADKKFEEPIEIIEAFDNESFIKAFNKIEDFKKLNKYYLLGYIRYEAKEIFLGKNIKSKLPLLYFEVYNQFKNKKTMTLKGKKDLSLQIKPAINYETYKKAIQQIKDEIACGNTYQVNYTYDYKIETDLNGIDLYQQILPRQITPYNAYIKNKYEEILSFSPELFFELENNHIKTKPMKGTIERGKTKEEDKKNIVFLQNDVKNRAENVMIVDLLRNDLGKIAKTATVKVDKLFEIETHKTVHQMTSEVSAELEENTTLLNIFEALFPCGSITGAPKINTMEIIDKLEVGSREIYCGAIGLISPEKTVFSVPIRILHKKSNERDFHCRVGGAIVWDSTPKDEWKETLTKIKFLQNEIKLIETILVENCKLKYKTSHFARLKKSAKELGYKFNPDVLDIKPKRNGILRLLLSKTGVIEHQYLTLDEIKTNKITVTKIPVPSNEKFLYYKTTHRPWYDESMQKIKAGLIFDEIFFNEREELTEGARSNIVLKLDDELFTPPVKSGLLNGILRQKLLQQGKIKEKILYLKDLKRADKIFCINSVRGIIEVQLEQ